MEMYGRLYEAHKKIVSVMQTGRRYLGTYYRVGFYGEVCEDTLCLLFHFFFSCLVKIT